jgi:hypothetical protein
MIKVISDRIAIAPPSSPILVTVEKSVDKLRLESSFASTVRAQQIIKSRASNIFGVFDRTMTERFKTKARKWVAENGT